MSNLLVQNIKHTNGTTAQEISTAGEVNNPQMTVAMFAPADNYTDSGTKVIGGDFGAWISLNNDTDVHFKNIGSPPTESSGIFTFPSTGVYEIHHIIGMYSTNDSRNAGTSIEIDSGSGYSAFWFYAQLENFGATGYSSAQGFTIVNVTNASTFRCRFRIDIASSTVIRNKYYSRTIFRKLAPSQ
jgi:hypothetical protein|tara:strand:- start:41 stop:595 length:555 start_codon:yes stop_codon:yes gene_type:complete